MHPKDALTVCASRTAKPGCEAAFERLLHDFVHRSLEEPGQLGVHVMRPAPGTGSREYGIIRKFSDQASADAFYSSDAFMEYIDQVRPLTEGVVRMEKYTGLESWVTMPDALLRPVKRWKQAVATVIGVYPTSLFLNVTVFPFIHDWPLLLRSLVFSILIVALLAWVVMPNVTRVMRPWLHPESSVKGFRHEGAPGGIDNERT